MNLAEGFATIEVAMNPKAGRRVGVAMSWMPALLVFAIATGVAEGAWPQFRGPGGGGVATNGYLPVYFGPQSNVLWKAPLPGGHSSPIVSQDRIFLTGFENGDLQTLCLDAATGRILWKRSLKPTKIERGARHPATSTPCTDGGRVFVYFGSYGAAAYAYDGTELWHAQLAVPLTQHGASSSPVLAGDLLILQRDADTDSHLLALRCKDGTIAWRTDRADARRSFCTPLVVDPAKGASPTLIVAGTLRVTGYEAASGQELWTVHGLPNEMCSSPVYADGTIFVAGWTPGSGAAAMPSFDALLERGDANKDGRLAQAEAPSGPARQHFQYIDANKDGFITKQEWDTIAEIFSKSQNAALAIRVEHGSGGDAPRVVWKQSRGLPYVPTPLVYAGRVYLVKNGGLLSCFNATNGAALYQEERIGALGDYYASPVAAAGRVCVISQGGTATVLAAGDELKVLSHNALGEPVLATPAIQGRTLYIRTASTLYAFQ